MNARILHIGVLDKQDRVHAVSFEEGMNVVTGRSSTGKSALIEIFDFCFGSSDFTVPVGVITECAAYYFTVMHVGEAVLVLGRRAEDRKAFLREEPDIQRFARADAMNAAYFEEDYFSPRSDFLRQLKRYFGVVVTDIDEDLGAREYRKYKSKSPTPSARSFTSYMLQHQNLVANKHAIFYRFEQKEKREQAIDHLKIFLGFADQTYFTMSQELNSLIQEHRTLERSLPGRAEAKEAARKRLASALREYEAISGKALDFDIATAVANPRVQFDALRATRVDVLADSDAHVRLKYEAEDQKRTLVAKLRRRQQELATVESSIRFSRQYADRSGETIVPESAELHASTCPFCKSQNDDVEERANDLTEAINWLNSELARSPYRLDSFQEEKNKSEKEVEAVRSDLAHQDRQIEAIEQQIEDLENVRNQYEIAVEAKLQVESILSDLADLGAQSDGDIEDLDRRIKNLRAYLKSEYDIDRKLADAADRIRNLLAKFGERFDFEESYTPIQLRFSLETFDLYHETESKQPVYLRSMGSGANWLACHLVLFLALQRYFCELGKDCSIPPILFFDQPSQVYFPSNIDGGSEFSAADLASKDSSRDASRTVDEDIKAVTNLFEQLVRYCQETKEATGIMPQIIVTDHADHLELAGDVTFESLVRKRWRQEGDGLINQKSH